MKKIIVLIGPPGVGKSTLVSLAKSKKINAFDIEDLHLETEAELGHLNSEEFREEMGRRITKMLEDLGEGVSIFGAGGYGGFFPNEKVTRVLLLPPKEVAKKRFEDRDSVNLVKQAEGQNFEQVYDYFENAVKSHPENYHIVVRDLLSAEDILELILRN